MKRVKILNIFTGVVSLLFGPLKKQIPDGNRRDYLLVGQLGEVRTY